MTDDSSYEANRRIGGAAAAAAPFRPPHLGATIELFGVPVTLGLGHLACAVLAVIFGGVEAVCALVILFLGVCFLTATPAPEPAPPSDGRPRPRLQREPGILGTLRYFFGPVR